MPPRPLRVGTRGSALARWQADWVAAALRKRVRDREIVIVEIKTQGDRDRNSPLAQIGGVGVFTKEIERALLENEVDVAVHSLKDLPTKVPDGLTIAAIPEREEPVDALIAPRFQTLSALPLGAKVGTGSLRRRAQLLNLRQDLEVLSIRGNVETRLRQALDGRLDAVVLAAAGLKRLNLSQHITQELRPPEFLPAVGQGALGIECRADDEETRALLEPLNHLPSRRAVVAERRTLAELEGGCMIPLAAWGRESVDRLALDVAVFSLDGTERLDAAAEGSLDDPDGLGLKVAQELRKRGVERLLRPLGKA